MNRGMADALRARKLRKGLPAEKDAPPPSVFPGTRPKVLPGQLDVFGREHGAVESTTGRDGERVT
jgi:hypothetical protein